MSRFYARLHRAYGPRHTADEHRRRVRSRIQQLRLRYNLGDGEFAPYSPRETGHLPSLVVIGAGFAGLMAAYMLSKNFRVTVLEARPRVGGRVFSLIDPKSKRVVEAGAELIGYNHPTWLLLAQEFDLGLVLLTSDENLATLDLSIPMEIGGKVLSRNELKNTYDEMTKAFASICRQAREIADPYKPWRTKGAHAIDQTPLSHWIDRLSCTDTAKSAIRIDLENTNAASADRQSLLANLSLVAGGALDGHADDFFNVSEVARCEKGNQALAKTLYRKVVVGGGIVHLSQPVHKIEVSRRGVSVSTKSATMQADYAVLAVPPSAWPTIVPALPAAYTVSMGAAIKYLSDMKSRFWLARQLSSNSASDAYGFTWDGTDNQTQVAGQNITFSLFAGGKAAQRALDIYQDKGTTALRTFYRTIIGKVYQDYATNLAGTPRFVAWPLERWTRAGYSNFAPGEVCRAGPLLTEPYHDRLYFAGEHVCLAFYGYMEGALQSGLATSMAILNRNR